MFSKKTRAFALMMTVAALTGCAGSEKGPGVEPAATTLKVTGGARTPTGLTLTIEGLQLGEVPWLSLKGRAPGSKVAIEMREGATDGSFPFAAADFGGETSFAGDLMASRGLGVARSSPFVLDTTQPNLGIAVVAPPPAAPPAVAAVERAAPPTPEGATPPEDTPDAAAEEEAAAPEITVEGIPEAIFLNKEGSLAYGMGELKIRDATLNDEPVAFRRWTLTTSDRTTLDVKKGNPFYTLKPYKAGIVTLTLTVDGTLKRTFEVPVYRILEQYRVTPRESITLEVGQRVPVLVEELYDVGNGVTEAFSFEGEIMVDATNNVAYDTTTDYLVGVKEVEADNVSVTFGNPEVTVDIVVAVTPAFAPDAPPPEPENLPKRRRPPKKK